MSGIIESFVHRARGVVCVALVATVACGGPPTGPVGVGDRLPAVDWPLLGGGEISTEELAGRPVVLAFWATWCTPCRRDEPVLQALHDSGEAAVVSVALDEGPPEVVARAVEERGLGYLVALGDQDSFLLFDGFGIPHTVVTDEDQRIVAVHRGPVELEQIRRDLDRASAAEAVEEGT